MRPFGSPEELERRRHRAIELLSEGYQPVQIAKALGVDRRSVRRWKASFQGSGTKALKARPAPGRPPKLAIRDLRKLERSLLKGAKSAGFSTDLWTCPRIVQLIQSQFHVSYHVDHVGRLLHSLGWSPQKPERRAVERNESAIAHWVKTQWPKIKKKPRN